jgi:hypothetical protein
MMEKDRRLIEETFPVKEVSIESAREKNIRHGHISTLHIWWARRPLESSPSQTPPSYHYSFGIHYFHLRSLYPSIEE